MNSHTISEAKNHNSVYSTKKRGGNVPNLSEMESTGLHYGVDFDFMLPASTLHQYSNMEYNDEYNYLFINGTISTSNNSSVSTLMSPSVTSINEKVCLLQNKNT